MQKYLTLTIKMMKNRVINKYNSIIKVGKDLMELYKIKLITTPKVKIF